MITITEEENKLLVYQDDKLIATDESIRLTFFHKLNGSLNTSINQIIEAADFSHKSGRYTSISIKDKLT